MVGCSGYSNVDFGEFLKEKFFFGSDFLFFVFGLIPASVDRYSNSAEKAEKTCYSPFFSVRLVHCINKINMTNLSYIN